MSPKTDDQRRAVIEHQAALDRAVTDAWLAADFSADDPGIGDNAGGLALMGVSECEPDDGHDERLREVMGDAFMAERAKTLPKAPKDAHVTLDELLEALDRGLGTAEQASGEASRFAGKSLDELRRMVAADVIDDADLRAEIERRNRR